MSLCLQASNNLLLAFHLLQLASPDRGHPTTAWPGALRIMPDQAGRAANRPHNPRKRKSAGQDPPLTQTIGNTVGRQ